MATWSLSRAKRLLCVSLSVVLALLVLSVAQIKPVNAAGTLYTATQVESGSRS